MVVWAVANAFGCYASKLIQLDLSLVSYILTAMFLGIWSNYLKNRTMVITGLTAGILAVLLAQMVPFKLHIVVASLLPSGVAAWLYLQHEKKIQPQKSAVPEEGSCTTIERGTEA